MTRSLHSGQDLEVLRRNFAAWLSVPAHLRQPKTQGEWAKENQIGRETLSRWKNDPEFKKDVVDAGLDWFTANDLNEIVLSLKIQAKKGNVPAAKLCLQMAGVITDGKPKDETPKSPEEMATLSDEDLARLASGEGLT